MNHSLGTRTFGLIAGIVVSGLLASLCQVEAIAAPGDEKPQIEQEHAHEQLVTHDDGEWTTLYETFDEARSEQAHSDQRLTNIPVSTVTGELRALVVNVSTPTRTALARDKIVTPYQQAATRVNLMSRGFTTVTVDFFGRDVQVPDVSNICTEYPTISSAAAEIVAKEVSLALYRSIDYVIPQLSTDQCDWAGRGEIGGRVSWNFGSGGEGPSYGTIVHEWGHQYSLEHLSAIRCAANGQDVVLVDRAGRGAGQCATSEYGGAFSVMGPSWANNSVAITFGERSQLGWLRTGEERRVHEGSFTLGYDGPLSLLWLQNAEGDVFQIEFVKSFTGGNTWGFTDPFSRKWLWLRDTPVFTRPGVMVKYLSSYRAVSSAPAGYYAKGFVLDATPETLMSTDAAFRAGQTFTDPTGSLVVEVVSVGENSADVKVRGVPFKPELVKNVGATATDVRGVFDVTFAPAAADAGVTHYEVQVSNNWEFTNPTTYAVTASPGRVIIPNHINFWTIYRVAAVSAVGRGEFSNPRLLEWARTATLQSTPKAVTPTNPVAEKVTCKKGKRTRSFSASACPKGWARV